jgi:carboxypeptidase family protein
MMLLCPKCGDYYADSSLAFCLADGAPLVGVDANSERWAEGSRIIEKKENTLKKKKRRRKWWRVSSVVTMLIVTMVVWGAVAKRNIYLEPKASPTPLPSPSSEPTVTPTPTPSPSPSPSSSPSPSPSAVYKIRGRVTDVDKPLRDVSIMIFDGASTVSTATDANGNYTFGGLPKGGSYTVTARARMKVTPPTRSFTNLMKDESADFSVQRNFYKISGRVTNNGEPLSGVNILLAGSKTDSTTTDANGNYAFGNLPEGGNHTVTPRARMKVTPPTRSFTNLTKDESADFSVQRNFYKISGRVTSNSGPVSGVNILLQGTKTASTATDADGNYTFGSLSEGGSYTITPGGGKINFQPTGRSINNLTRDESADFSRLDQPKVYKISGRVTEVATAKPLSGINIFLKGAKTASTKTDADGNYTFGSLPEGGNYTITPDRAEMNFTPRDRSIRKLTRDESANFSLAAPECSAVDKDREEQIIRNQFPTWRRNIQSEREKIIAENVPAGAIEQEAVLGEIEFQVTVLIPCKSAAVAARYVWQVSYSVSDSGYRAVRQTRTVPRRRTIGCGKVLGMWVCH